MPAVYERFCHSSVRKTIPHNTRVFRQLSVETRFFSIIFLLPEREQAERRDVIVTGLYLLSKPISFLFKPWLDNFLERRLCGENRRRIIQADTDR